MDKAVMIGCYHNLKVVSSRNVVQMLVEFPLESMPEVIRLFGPPRPSEELAVAVAALDPAVCNAGVVNEHGGTG